MRDITERATVNRATFYAHFDDKYALFDHIVRESFKQELETFLPASAELSRDNLKRVVLAVCEYLSKLAKTCSASDEQVRPLVETQIQSQLYHLLLAWIASRLGDGTDLQVQPEIAASFLSWAIFGVGLQWSHSPTPAPADVVADEVLRLVTKGCALGLLP